MKSENQKLDEVLKELDKIKLENNILKQQVCFNYFLKYLPTNIRK